MRAQRYRCVPSQMGCGAFQDCAAGGRGFLVSTGLGLLAPGIGRLLRGRRGRPLRRPPAWAIGRQVDVNALRKANQGLGLVRGHACIRQRASSAGADRNRIENEHTDLRRRWPAIATLAQVATNRAIGMLQAGRHRELRQTSTRPGSVRSTAGRGGSNDFRVPCCVAGRWRPGVAWRSDACVRLVSGRERPAHGAHRCGYGQLLGWASSGSTQREQRRRVGAVVSSCACGDTRVQASYGGGPKETRIQIGARPR
jgi:hypothetical protein